MDAIIKLVKTTLEKIRKRISASQSSMGYSTDFKETGKKEIPVFKSFAVLAIPAINMQPTLDEIQQSLNRSVQNVVNVSKNISQWSKGRRVNLKKRDNFQKEVESSSTEQEKESTEDDGSVILMQKNYHRSVTENKDIAKMISLLFTCISYTKKEVLTALERFKGYQFIWQKDRDDDLKEFLSSGPKVSEFEYKIKSFDVLIDEINSYAEYIPVGAIALVTEKLKLGLTSEIHLWKACYGQACNQKYKKEINEIFVFIDEVMKRLQREIKDLDDIRLAMAALKEVRDNEIRIDMTIMPIEESYAMLQKHQIEVPREEIERCDTLRYSWQKLLQTSSQTSSYLLEIQPLYKDGLKSDVQDFIKECANYYTDYKKVWLFFTFL